MISYMGSAENIQILACMLAGTKRLFRPVGDQILTVMDEEPLDAELLLSLQIEML